MRYWGHINSSLETIIDESYLSKKKNWRIKCPACKRWSHETLHTLFGIRFLLAISSVVRHNIHRLNVRLSNTWKNFCFRRITLLLPFSPHFVRVGITYYLKLNATQSRMNMKSMGPVQVRCLIQTWKGTRHLPFQIQRQIQTSTLFSKHQRKPWLVNLWDWSSKFIHVINLVGLWRVRRRLINPWIDTLSYYQNKSKCELKNSEEAKNHVFLCSSLIFTIPPYVLVYIWSTQCVLLKIQPQCTAKLQRACTAQPPTLARGKGYKRGQYAKWTAAKIVNRKEFGFRLKPNLGQPAEEVLSSGMHWWCLYFEHLPIRLSWLLLHDS